MFWNSTITLYNRHVNNQSKIEWYRHVINGCFVKHTYKDIQSGNVQSAADSNIVRIPEQNNFISPYEWITLSDELKTKKITLQKGDLIVFGEVSDDIDEYNSGQRSSDLIAKYTALGSIFIKEIKINTLLPNSHYYIT